MEAKYTFTRVGPGSASNTPAANLKDINSFIAYLLSEKQPGESITVTITKNK